MNFRELENVMDILRHIEREARDAGISYLTSEALQSVKTLIRLEHDAHLREIRRLGT